MFADLFEYGSSMSGGCLCRLCRFQFRHDKRGRNYHPAPAALSDREDMLFLRSFGSRLLIRTLPAVKSIQSQVRLQTSPRRIPVNTSVRQIYPKRAAAYISFPSGTMSSMLTIAIHGNTAKSSAARELHGCVVVLDGRQPACVRRLALQSPPSPPFFRSISVDCYNLHGRHRA